MHKARKRQKDKTAGISPGGLAEVAKQISDAEALRRTSKLDKAKRICTGLLNRMPDYSAAHHTMGLVCADMHNYPQALSHLVRALMHDPDNWKTLTALSGVYLRLGASVMAARVLEQAAVLQPDDAGILVTLGEIYRGDREYERAVTAFRQAVAGGAGAAARYGLGLCLMELGELPEAAALFEGLVAGGDRSITTLNALSEVAPELLQCDLLSLIDAAAPTDDQSQSFFDMAHAFTRAAALAAAGRHAESWPALVAANELVADSVKQDWIDQSEVQNTILQVARTAAVQITTASMTEGYPLSLFVLGVSRSGKTTAERLIGTLHGVKRGYENPIVENSVKQACRSVGLPALSKAIELPPGLEPQWREAYLSELEDRAGGANVFTNTHPGQIENALRIASVLPNARFLLVKRDRRDTALRIFQKIYRSGNPYAYNLDHIYEHIDWYNQMIDVVAEKAPAIARVITYDDMVENPSLLLKAAAELCGLPDPSDTPPAPGDDRDCSAPYDWFIREMSEG